MVRSRVHSWDLLQGVRKEEPRSLGGLGLATRRREVPSAQMGEAWVQQATSELPTRHQGGDAQ